MKKIFLIMMAMSLVVNADFSKSGDIVTDSYSNLEWQDTDDIGTVSSWQGAIDRCEGLTLEMHTDWHLPNINELRSIVDRTQSNPVTVGGFTNTSSNNYWSSSSHILTSTKAWFISFNDGTVSYVLKSDSAYVRCVRAGESSEI